jgi:hypothetical protein
LAHKQNEVLVFIKIAPESTSILGLMAANLNVYRVQGIGIPV